MRFLNFKSLYRKYKALYALKYISSPFLDIDGLLNRVIGHRLRRSS